MKVNGTCYLDYITNIKQYQQEKTIMTKENLPNYYGSPSVDETIEVKPTYTEKKVNYKNKVWEEVHRLKKLYEKRKR